MKSMVYTVRCIVRTWIFLGIILINDNTISYTASGGVESLTISYSINVEVVMN